MSGRIDGGWYVFTENGMHLVEPVERPTRAAREFDSSGWTGSLYRDAAIEVSRKDGQYGQVMDALIIIWCLAFLANIIELFFR